MDPQTFIKAEIGIAIFALGLQLLLVIVFLWFIARFVSAHEKIANAMFTIATHFGLSRQSPRSERTDQEKYGPKG